MSKSEFLKKLKDALLMRVNEDTIREQIKYYDNYISDEVKKGRSEKEVIDELGDPLLLAKTISTVNTVSETKTSSDNTSESYSNDEYENRSERKARTSGRMYQPYISNTGILGCAITFLLIFIVVMGLLRFFGYIAYGVGALAFSGPIGFVLVIALLYLLFGRGRR